MKFKDVSIEYESNLPKIETSLNDSLRFEKIHENDQFHQQMSTVFKDRDENKIMNYEKHKENESGTESLHLIKTSFVENLHKAIQINKNIENNIKELKIKILSLKNEQYFLNKAIKKSSILLNKEMTLKTNLLKQIIEESKSIEKNNKHNMNLEEASDDNVVEQTITDEGKSEDLSIQPSLSSYTFSSKEQLSFTDSLVKTIVIKSLPLTTKNIFNKMYLTSDVLTNTSADFTMFNNPIKRKKSILCEFKIRHGIPPRHRIKPIKTFYPVSLNFDCKAISSRKEMDEIIGDANLNKIQYGNMLAKIILKKMSFPRVKNNLKNVYNLVKRGKQIEKKKLTLKNIEADLCLMWNKCNDDNDVDLLNKFERKSIKKLDSVREGYEEQTDTIYRSCYGILAVLKDLEVQSAEEVEMMYAGVETKTYRIKNNSKTLRKLFRAIQTCRQNYRTVNKIDATRQNLLLRLKLLRKSYSLESVT